MHKFTCNAYIYVNYTLYYPFQVLKHWAANKDLKNRILKDILKINKCKMCIKVKCAYFTLQKRKKINSWFDLIYTLLSVPTKVPYGKQLYKQNGILPKIIETIGRIKCILQQIAELNILY